jgi:hypothetical protein
MNPVWAQRREEVLSDCLVSPDVFHQMVERLDEFVVPYQRVLETATGQRNVHLYLQGLLSGSVTKRLLCIRSRTWPLRIMFRDLFQTVRML